jgi:large subunit ribosomal protein L43
MSRRGVPQLKRLAFNVCDHGGSSSGARAFLEHYLPSFAKEHPHLVIETSTKAGKHPTVQGFYVNGRVRSVGLKNESPGEVLRQVMNMRSTVGRRTSTGTKANRSVKQRVVTSTPSIQKQKL